MSDTGAHETSPQSANTYDDSTSEGTQDTDGAHETSQSSDTSYDDAASEGTQGSDETQRPGSRQQEEIDRERDDKVWEVISKVKDYYESECKENPGTKLNSEGERNFDFEVDNLWGTRKVADSLIQRPNESSITWEGRLKQWGEQLQEQMRLTYDKSKSKKERERRKQARF